MIAKARAIPHGNAYVTYATLKKDAILVGTLNMDCDNILSLNPAEDAWEEFKNENFKNHNRMWEEHKSNPNFHIPKKEVTRTLIAMEVSPSLEESADWKIYKKDTSGNPILDSKGNPKWEWDLDSWFNFGWDFLSHVDAIEFTNKEGRISAKRTDLCNSKILMILHTDSKSGIPHLHIMVSRFNKDGFTNCANLIGMKAVTAANQINQEQGWVQPNEISNKNKAAIKDLCYNILRRMPTWSLDDYFAEMQKEGFKIEPKESNGVIFTYNIYMGKNRYKPSEIGANLTVKKLEKEWQKIHNQMALEKANANQSNNSLHGNCNTHNNGTTPSEFSSEKSTKFSPKNTPLEKVSYEMPDGTTGKKLIPKFVHEIIKENIELPEESDYENEIDGIPHIPDAAKVTEIAVGIFLQILLEDSPTTSGGGGGSSSGWNDNDKDKLKDWALRAAQYASSKCTPIHSAPIRKRKYKR